MLVTIKLKVSQWTVVFITLLLSSLDLTPSSQWSQRLPQNKKTLVSTEKAIYIYIRTLNSHAQRLRTLIIITILNVRGHWILILIVYVHCNLELAVLPHEDFDTDFHSQCPRPDSQCLWPLDHRPDSKCLAQLKPCPDDESDTRAATEAYIPLKHKWILSRSRSTGGFTKMFWGDNLYYNLKRTC
ncbi:hypothetical protein TNCV_3641941 [Trichonephila clavipes]|nr:hypothetical protein TNCV_3641941 [Trichonephila clavipes]